MTAAGDGGGSTFALGSDPLPGTFTAVISAGDLPDWPAALADCAAVAQIALPNFHATDIPLTWGPLQAPPDPLLGPIDSARTGSAAAARGVDRLDLEGGPATTYGRSHVDLVWPADSP